MLAENDDVMLYLLLLKQIINLDNQYTPNKQPAHTSSLSLSMVLLSYKMLWGDSVIGTWNQSFEER